MASIYGIKSVNSLFSICPNPSSDVISLSINSKKEDFALNIYNLTGTLVKKEKVEQNQQQINISDLSNGIYVVEINSKERIGRQKLLIQR